jgi:hypothetical protein
VVDRQRQFSTVANVRCRLTTLLVVNLTERIAKGPNMSPLSEMLGVPDPYIAGVATTALIWVLTNTLRNRHERTLAASNVAHERRLAASNIRHERNLARQTVENERLKSADALQTAVTQQDRERRLAMQRDVFLAVFENLSRLTQSTMRLIDVYKPASEALVLHEDRIAFMARLSVVGNMETIHAAQRFMSRIVEIQWNLVRARAPADACTIELDYLQHRITESLQNRESARDVVRQAEEHDQSNPGGGARMLPRVRAARETVRSLTNAIDNMLDQKVVLVEKRRLVQQSISRTGGDLMRSIVPLSAAILKSMRDELELGGFDVAEFIAIANQASALIDVVSAGVVDEEEMDATLDVTPPPPSPDSGGESRDA